MKFRLHTFLPNRLMACPLLLTGIACISQMRGQAPLNSSELSEARPAVLAAQAKDMGPLSFSELKDITVHDDALLLLTKHLAASSSWTALRVKGSVMLAGAGKELPAELLVQNLNQATLKIDQASGITSIAVEGAFRKTTYADGTSNVDPSPQGPAGLLPLQLLHSAVLPEYLLALKLQGTETVAGIACDKVSLRYVLTKAKAVQGKLPHNVQVDFYLDAKTHLIVQSVSSLQVPGLAQPQLQTTTYGGYKAFGLITFPTRITQTIGGMPLWDLTVASASQENKIDSREFVK